MISIHKLIYVGEGFFIEVIVKISNLDDYFCKRQLRFNYQVVG